MITDELLADLLEKDAAAKGHQFSDVANGFMQLKYEQEKECEELKYKKAAAKQVVSEALSLLTECIPHITGGPSSSYLNNRIAVWIESVKNHFYVEKS